MTGVTQQRSASDLGFSWTVMVGLILGCSVPCSAQTAPPANPASGAVQHTEVDRKQTATEQRQQRQQDDAEKLLQMAKQLQSDVGKTNRNTLSVQVVREAERIEKFAHQLREGNRE